MIQRNKHPAKIAAAKVGVILFCSILCFPLNLFCVIVINSITTSSQNDLSFWTIFEEFYGLNQRCTYLLILSTSTFPVNKKIDPLTSRCCQSWAWILFWKIKHFYDFLQCREYLRCSNFIPAALVFGNYFCILVFIHKKAINSLKLDQTPGFISN